MRSATSCAVLVAALLAAPAVSPAAAQSSQATPPGWTLFPSVSYGGTYDDNISLVARNTAESENNDYISTVQPALDLRFAGRRSLLGLGYTGSLVNYRTFSALDRYNQSLSGRFQRRESERFQWTVDASALTVPSTDLIDLGGIPYQQTAATTKDASGGVEMALTARSSLSGRVHLQEVDFERPDTQRPALPGGHVQEYSTAYSRRQSARMALGADYTFRRSRIARDPELFNSQMARATFEYRLSPAWRLSGGGGVIFLASTAVTEAHSSPAWNVSLERNEQGRIFRGGYTRSYIPSFGYGGTVDNHELGASMEWPIARRFYTANGISYRHNSPLTDLTDQLPLRSLRMSSVWGWSPRPWVHVEAFYARVQQNSETDASRIGRNRFGFQIVTSTPVRIR